MTTPPSNVFKFPKRILKSDSTPTEILQYVLDSEKPIDALFIVAFSPENNPDEQNTSVRLISSKLVSTEHLIFVRHLVDELLLERSFNAILPIDVSGEESDIGINLNEDGDEDDDNTTW